VRDKIVDKNRGKIESSYKQSEHKITSYDTLHALSPPLEHVSANSAETRHTIASLELEYVPGHWEETVEHFSEAVVRVYPNRSKERFSHRLLLQSVQLNQYHFQVLALAVQHITQNERQNEPTQDPKFVCEQNDTSNDMKYTVPNTGPKSK
jgi:hypothetical protein